MRDGMLAVADQRNDALEDNALSSTNLCMRKLCGRMQSKECMCISVAVERLLCNVRHISEGIQAIPDGLQVLIAKPGRPLLIQVAMLQQ